MPCSTMVVKMFDGWSQSNTFPTYHLETMRQVLHLNNIGWSPTSSLSIYDRHTHRTTLYRVSDGQSSQHFPTSRFFVHLTVSCWPPRSLDHPRVPIQRRRHLICSLKSDSTHYPLFNGRGSVLHEPSCPKRDCL